MFESYELKRFGETIKKLRISLGFSQQAVVDSTGVHIDTLRKIENGYTVPKFDTLTLLSSIYNINLNSVFIKTMTSHDLVSGYKLLDTLIDHRQFSRIGNLVQEYESIKATFERYDDLIFKKELSTLKMLFDLAHVRYNGTPTEKRNQCIPILRSYLNGSLVHIRKIDLSKFDDLQMRLLLVVSSILGDLKYRKISDYITLKIIARLSFLNDLFATDNKLLLRAYYVLTTSYHQQNRQEKALQVALQGIRLSVDMDILSLLPYFYARKGVAEYLLDYPEAEQTLLDCIALSRLSHPDETYQIYKANGEKFIQLVKEKQRERNSNKTVE